jgi:AcrR family transcriptional regulator
VTENADLVTGSEARREPATERAERLDRMLDAASELLVRWGYRRVTIEDVADRAGVGKGTVYLHFPNKEALFLTVLLRGYRAIIDGVIARLRADPGEVLPARMMRSLFLALRADPVARPIYFGDTELLGRLAKEATDTLGPLRERGNELNQAHLRLLRDAGLLRTDRPVVEQHYLLRAVSTGFWFLESFPVQSGRVDPDARAELQEYALAAALEVPGRPDPTPELAESVAQLYESLIEHVDAEWRRRALGPDHPTPPRSTT